MKVNVSYCWKLKRVILEELEEKECVSLAFLNTGIPDVCFSIRVYPCVYDEDKKDFNVFFGLVVKSKSDVDVEFNFSIDSKYFLEHVPYQTFSPFDVERRVFVKSSKELFKCGSCFFDENSIMKLNICGTFKSYNSYKNFCIEEHLLPFWKKDFFIMCDGKVIQVHKNVLRHYSSVFTKQIDDTFIDACLSSLEIFDFESDIVDIAINHCYGLPCPDDMLLLVDLLRFAYRFDMRELRDEIEDRLCDMINSWCVVFILNETFLFASDRLVSYCVKILVECVRKTVFVSESEKLSKEILLKVIKCLFVC